MGVSNSELIGKTSEQKKVTKYFLDTGLLAALFRMKDEEYESMVMSKLKSLDLKKKALGKIGLDEDQVKEITPVFLHGYNFDDEAYVRIGSDDRLRSSRYDGTWLFFSDSHVYMYSYTLDLASDYKKEVTEEYFYKDVTNLSTSSESKPFAKLTCMGQEIKKTREFSRFSLVVPGDKFFCSMAGVTAAEAEKSVNAMKQKLREKKQS